MHPVNNFGPQTAFEVFFFSFLNNSESCDKNQQTPSGELWLSSTLCWWGAPHDYGTFFFLNKRNSTKKSERDLY